MGRGSAETTDTHGSALLYGRVRRTSRAARKTIARASKGVPSGAFEHPNFKPGLRRLGTAYFYEARPRGAQLRFSGTNQWIARVDQIPEDWRPQFPKMPVDDVYVSYLLGKTGMNPHGSQGEIEPITPVQLEPAHRPEGTISWFSQVNFPEHADLEGFRVNADHAMAVYKLAGEHGYWQFELSPQRSIKNMALTLRDEESDEVIGVVSLYGSNE